MNHLKRIQMLLDAEAPIKWLFAGDSITHGAFHTLGYRDYVEHFSERIRWERRRLRDCVITTAVSGRKISDLARDLDWSVLQHSPQVVSINFGINDCANDGPDGITEFRDHYLKVLIGSRRS